MKKLLDKRSGRWTQWRSPQCKMFAQIRFELYSLSYYIGGAHWNNSNVVLPCNAFYFVLGGDGHIEDHRKHMRLRAGYAYLLPINVKHRSYCDTSIEKYWGCFSMELFPQFDVFELMDEIVELGPFEIDDPSYFTKRLERWSMADYFYFQSMIYRLFGGLDDYFSNVLTRHSRNAELYSGLFSFVDDRLDARLKVGEIAEAVKLSPPHLSRMFKQDIGVTLKSFLSGKLNQKACALLSGTNLKVKDIAHKLGYDDEYYFLRAFKNQNGQSPSQYRESLPKMV